MVSSDNLQEISTNLPLYKMDAVQVLSNISQYIIYTILLQVHICSLPGDHFPGFDCLPDEQILPLLLAIDSETLLKVGRTSQRLHTLVCDRRVWRHLLKGLDLTKERVKEVLLFALGSNGSPSLERIIPVLEENVSYQLNEHWFKVWSSKFGIKRSPEMLSEVLKEVATQSIYLTGAVKLTIKIQSWGAPDTFEVEASYLGKLIYVALVLGVKFNILEVWIPLWNKNTIESIVCASKMVHRKVLQLFKLSNILVRKNF